MKKLKIVWTCPYSLKYLINKYEIQLIEKKQLYPATWLYFLQKELQNHKDLDLHIITISKYINKEYILHENNVTYYILKAIQPPLSKVLKKIFFGFELYFFHLFFFTEKKMIKYVNKIDPDIINPHGTENNYAIILNKLKNKYPSVIFMQGVINLVEKGKKSLRALSRLRTENAVFKKQQNYITVPGNMEEIISEYNKDAHFYHLDYPINDFCFQLYNKEFKKDSDLIFVGSISKSKGIEDLVNAVGKVSKNLPDIKVKVIGKSLPKYLEYIKSMIKIKNLNKNFNILGFIERHDEVMKEVKKSRIFVLPTHVDSGPRSVAESMAIGTPVISYNIDGLPEMIENGKSGILVEKSNINSLAEAIINLLNNEKLRETLSKNAKRYSKNNFYAPIIAKKLINIYYDVIRRYNE